MFAPLQSFSREMLIVLLPALACAARGAEAASAPASANPRYAGSPFMQSWLAGDYGASQENFCAVQDPRTGFIYVGNGDGLLEFDGVRWRLITEPGGSLVRSLCVDRRGRIWGCGRLSVFRLEPDARGEMRARSMQDQVSPAVSAGGPAFRVVANSRGVYACSGRFLMFFEDDHGPAQAWPVPGREGPAVSLSLVADEPYVEVGAPAHALFRLRDARLERVPGLTSEVFAARTEGDGTWQLATRRGMERWNGAELRPGERPIGQAEALQTVFLPDGRIVIATVNRGLVVCDRTGRRLQTIGRAEGLPSNQVRGLATDREGGVWLALSSGIARLQLDSPYARSGPAQGLDGTVTALLRHRDALVIGGSEGVARLGSDGRFHEWPGLPGPVRGLVSSAGWLLAAGTQLRGVGPGSDEAQVLDPVGSYAVLPLAQAPGWYAHASTNGLAWAHFVGGTWASEGPLTTIAGVPTSLFEAPAGVVWALIGAEGSAWRIDYRDGLSGHAPARRFGIGEGLPAGTGVVAVFQLGGDAMALVNGRLRRYAEATATFELEARVAGLEGFSIEQVYPDRDGTVWLQGGAPTFETRRIVPDAGDPIPRRGPARHWHAELLPGDPLRNLQPIALFHDETTRTLWLAGQGALVSYDLTWRPTRPSRPPVTLLRSIETASGQYLAGLNSPAPPTSLGAFEPDQTSLSLSFAVPTYVPDYEGAVRIQYRTRLDGFDPGWTAWSEQAERHLTNLPWRAFTFRVQARDGAGRIGPEAAMGFSIRPAWWATWWACAADGLLAVLGLAGIVRLRTRALRRRSRQLEEIVRDRTRELAASNAELARLHRLELDEKIAAQLAEEKARLEVLRYQLNPHFLFNSLNSVYGLLFENARAAGEMVLRLSDFCRTALTGAHDDWPTLAAELAALHTYLEVEKVRWGEDLQIELAVDPEAEAVRLPPFLLLPLVENAIKYGSQTSPGVLRLAIRARSEDGALLIEVANTGAWLEPDPGRPASTGIGLENLRQRLRRYYPGTHAFTTAAKDGWVVVRLRFERLLQPGEPQVARP